MKYEMCPVVNPDELGRALTLQYGENEAFNDIVSFLFDDDDYENGSYKSFHFDELDVYEGYSRQREEYIRIINCMKTFLQDTFPGHDMILIDVNW
jgi:hypothetical protein